MGKRNSTEFDPREAFNHLETSLAKLSKAQNSNQDLISEVAYFTACNESALAQQATAVDNLTTRFEHQETHNESVARSLTSIELAIKELTEAIKIPVEPRINPEAESVVSTHSGLMADRPAASHNFSAPVAGLHPSRVQILQRPTEAGNHSQTSAGELSAPVLETQALRNPSVGFSELASDPSLKPYYPKAEEWPKYDGRMKTNHREWILKIENLMKHTKVLEGTVIARLPFILTDAAAKLNTKPTHGVAGFVKKRPITDILHRNLTLRPGSTGSRNLANGFSQIYPTEI